MPAPSQALLTSNADSVDATSFTTASIAPGANRLVVASVFSFVGTGNPNIPTLTGNGLTYTQEDTFLSGTIRVTVFRALSASPSSGTVAIDFAGQTQTSCCWIFDEFDGVDTSGTNGSGAVLQSVTNTGSGTVMSATLAAFDHADNGTYGTFARAGTGTCAPGTNFTETADVQSNASNLAAEWQAANDTSVDATGSASVGWTAIALEIVATQAAAAETDTGIVRGLYVRTPRVVT